MNAQTLISEIAFLDSVFAVKPRQLYFSGHILVDFLTWDHNEYNLDVLFKIVFIDVKVSTVAKMRFSHVDRLLNYTCIMEASFNLDLNDFISTFTSNSVLTSVFSSCN